MENRDRDKMSKNVGSTSAGDVNRSTSSNLDKSKNDSQSNFGKNIGRSEDLSNEPSRRSGSVGDSGMQGGMGRSSQGSSGLGSSGSSSEIGSSSSSDSSSSDGSSRGSSGSSGRH
jgi:trimeric autotransporter adhesin